MLDELLRTLREWMDYQRMLSRKRILNSFPLHITPYPLYDFLPYCGLKWGLNQTRIHIVLYVFD